MTDREDCDVRLIDLPPDVGGFIHESPDGYTNIYINARHGWRGQRRSLDHELRHAEGDDLHSAEPVADIEARAGSADQRLKDIPHLVKARDLQNPPGDQKPSPSGEGGPRSGTDEVASHASPVSPAPLTPRQSAVLLTALSDLDRFLFTDSTYDY